MQCVCAQFRRVPGGRAVGGRAGAGRARRRAAAAGRGRARAAHGPAQQPTGDVLTYSHDTI